MKSLYSLALVLLMAVYTFAESNFETCQYEHKLTNSKFDISSIPSINNDGSWITIERTEQEQEGDFRVKDKLFFKICNTHVTTPKPYTVCEDQAAAHFVSYKNDGTVACTPLSLSKVDLWKMGLINPQHPGLGMFLEYSVDEAHKDVHKPLKINLHCGNGNTKIDDSNSDLIVLNMYTTVGCPSGCPVSQGKVCSGQGICEHDSKAVSMKCFCNINFGGNDCSGPYVPDKNVKPSSCDGTCAALIVFMFMLGGVLAALVVMSYRLFKNSKVTVGMGDGDNLVIDE